MNRLNRLVLIASKRTDGPFTELEVAYHIGQMRQNGAPGEDGITADILKHAAPVVAPLFSVFFTSLFKLGYFPERWKVGVAILIPKKIHSNFTAGNGQSSPTDHFAEHSSQAFRHVNQRPIKLISA